MRQFSHDIMTGIKKNQTTVEYNKDIYGIQFSTNKLLSDYMGFSWIDYILPITPKQTHNYLELSYSLEDLNFRNQSI